VTRVLSTLNGATVRALCAHGGTTLQSAGLDGKLARLSGPIITEAVAHHDPMFAELHRLNGVCWIQRCWGLLSERHARTDTPGQPTMPSVPGGSSAGRRPQGRDVF